MMKNHKFSIYVGFFLFKLIVHILRSCRVPRSANLRTTLLYYFEKLALGGTGLTEYHTVSKSGRNFEAEE